MDTTDTAPARLDQVAALAAQLGRRPSSNEVRRALKCGREVANRLLADLAGPDTATGPATPDTVSDPPADQHTAIRAGLGSATGPDTDHPQAIDQATEAPVHRAWLVLLALPAMVAVWGGWVGLGGLAGFGPVDLLPGIALVRVNLAVTLPFGMEVYSIIGLRVWLSGRTRSQRTRRFAARSSCAALAVGCLGQVAYHVLARPATGAPVLVTVAVACLPVAILGLGAALFHLVGEDQRTSTR